MTGLERIRKNHSIKKMQSQSPEVTEYDQSPLIRPELYNEELTDLMTMEQQAEQ